MFGNIPINSVLLGSTPVSRIALGSEILWEQVQETPFNPSDIEGLLMYFDASNETTITSTGSDVTRWDDASGNGFYATSTGVNTPSTGTRFYNNKNVLDFDYSTNIKFLSVTHDDSTIFDTLKSKLLSDHTIFVVGAADIVSATKTFIGAENASGADRYFVGGANNALRFYSGSSVISETHGTLPFIATMGRTTDNTTVFQAKDGKMLTDSPVNTALTGAETVTIGALNTSGQNRLDGWIGKIILYDRQLTPAEITQVEQWLSSEYGILLDYDDITVIIGAGQSNMASQAGPASISGELDTRIFDFDVSGTINNNNPRLAVEPLDSPQIHPNAGTTLIYSYAKEYLRENPNKKVLIVMHAVGGTGFSNNRWNVGDDLYEGLIIRANAALSWGSGVKTLDKFLWHQGEADAAFSSADFNIHANNLDSLIAGVRSSITGATNIGFILGGFVPNFDDPSYDAVKFAISDTPNRVTNAAYVSSDGLTDTGDNLHFDGPSQIEFGRRYYAASKTLT